MKDYFEHIDDFVEGKLTVEENALFEAEMNSNASLKEAVNNYDDAKKISEGLLELDMMETLNDLQEKSITTIDLLKTKSTAKWMGIAASIALLLLASWWMLNNQSTNLNKNQILATYQMPIDNDATKSIDTIGLNAFEKGKYYFALNRFEESKTWLLGYISKDLDSISRSETYYWLGAAHIELWEVDEAKAAWKNSDEKWAKENLNLIKK